MSRVGVESETRMGRDRETVIGGTYAAESNDERLPRFLTVAETASLLRTSPKAVYTMVDRGKLPGVTRIGRRVLVRSRDLLEWLDHNCASSPKELRR
jgi:excisionase family DNA binding protein